MKIPLLCILIAIAPAADAAYTDAGGMYTAGPGGYSGFSAFGEGGDDDYYVRAGLNSYSSDLSDRISTYFLGAGLDRERWSGFAELSLTPENGGYKNSGAYADLIWNLISLPEDDSLLQDAAVGAFASAVFHEDIYAASTATVSTGRRGTASVTLTDAFKLTQTDYGLSAAVKAAGLRLSARFTKTAYDKDVTAEARELPVDVGGIGASGFPDTAVSLRLRLPGLPVVPEAGYTRTTYLLDQPASEAVRLGLSFKTGPAELSAGWENFNPGGGAGRSDYYSAGLTWAFGE